MAAKQLPIVGEAFLGSDPFVSKIVKVQLGASAFSGVNDVDLTTSSNQTLLSFADTGFFLENIAFRVVEGFSSLGELTIGNDTSPAAVLPAVGAVATALNITSAGILMDITKSLSTAVIAVLPTGTDYGLLLGMPANSTSSLEVSWAGAAVPTIGSLEMYVYYHEIS